MTDKTTRVMIPEKKEYARTILSEFGGVARLSQGGTSPGIEQWPHYGKMSEKPSCL